MTQPQAKFNNGDVVRDMVSGYEGMVIGTTLWLNGCYRYVVQARSLDSKTGKPIEDVGFDEHQLELVTARAFQKDAKKETTHKTGGPWPTPRQENRR